MIFDFLNFFILPWFFRPAWDVIDVKILLKSLMMIVMIFVNQFNCWHWSFIFADTLKNWIKKSIVYFYTEMLILNLIPDIFLNLKNNITMACQMVKNKKIFRLNILNSWILKLKILIYFEQFFYLFNIPIIWPWPQMIVEFITEEPVIIKK